jgi:hypothetical protein
MTIHTPTIYLIVAVQLLACWHQQINELITPTPQPYGTCRLYSRSIYSVCVLCIHILLFIASFMIVFGKVSDSISHVFIPICLILFGAFLIMSIKPPTWALSFKDPGCYNHYNHGVISRTSTTGYMLFCVGAVLLIQSTLTTPFQIIGAGGAFSIVSFLMFLIFRLRT